MLFVSLTTVSCCLVGLGALVVSSSRSFCTQASNSTSTSATLNSYSLTAAAPSPGVDPPSSAPLAALGSKPQASKLGTPMARRLLGVPTLSTPPDWGRLGSGRQQQLVVTSLSPSNATKLQLAGLSMVLTQYTQHAQRMLSRTQQALEAAVAKLADCVFAAPQHAQRAQQHARQLLSRTAQALKAAVLKLADCAAAAPQHAQQLLSRAKHAVKAAVSKHTDRVAALCSSAHHQGAELLGRFGGAMHRRALAAGTPASVDLEVTVNVPSGQSGSATQARIEGPSFAPALQQSLSNAGMLVLRHAIFCSGYKADIHSSLGAGLQSPNKPQIRRNNSIVCIQSGTSHCGGRWKRPTT